MRTAAWHEHPLPVAQSSLRLPQVASRRQPSACNTAPSDWCLSAPIRSSPIGSAPCGEEPDTANPLPREAAHLKLAGCAAQSHIHAASPAAKASSEPKGPDFLENHSWPSRHLPLHFLVLQRSPRSGWVSTNIFGPRFQTIV